MIAFFIKQEYVLLPYSMCIIKINNSMKINSRTICVSLSVSLMMFFVLAFSADTQTASAFIVGPNTSSYCPNNNSAAPIDYVLVAPAYPQTPAYTSGFVYDTRTTSSTLNPGDKVFLAGYRVGTDPEQSYYTDDALDVATSIGTLTHSYAGACNGLLPETVPWDITSIFSTGSESSPYSITANYTFRDICGAGISHSDYYLTVVHCGTGQSCTPNDHKQCVGNNVYWYNSCGAQESLYQTCGSNQTCQAGACVNQNISCSSNTDCGSNGYTGSNFCQSNSVYKNYLTYTCNNAGTTQSYCSTNTVANLQQTCNSNQTCSSGSCNNQNTCTQNSYKQCGAGNSVYWYDSCGSQGSLYQVCNSNQVCSGSICQNTYVNNIYNNYTNHSFRGCENNIAYWYDSNGTRQDIYQNCNLTNQACNNGSCVGSTYTNTTTSTVISNPYVLHYTTKCYNSNVYWYDNKGKVQDLNQTCTDSNSCTVDGCTSGNCQNVLKCDGSTCAVGSADYVRYCSTQTVSCTITPQGGTINTTPTNGNLTASISENSFTDFLKQWYLWIIVAIILIFLFFMAFRRSAVE